MYINQMNLSLLFAMIFSLSLSSLYTEKKAHEIWWEKNLKIDETFDTFAGWLGGIDAPSRNRALNHINDKGYQSILDVPCGLCVDYFIIKKMNFQITYTGLDITEELVTRSNLLGINSILGDIENIPFANNQFDVSYARHILEHLDNYEQAIIELVRVSKKEVLIVFFIKPTAEDDDIINLAEDRNCLLYHNCYSRSKLERFLSELYKINSIEWENVNENEEMLHIYLKS